MNLVKLILVLVILIGAQSIENVCKEVSCRPSRQMVLLDSDGGRYKFESGRIPFVYRDDIIMLPNDDHYIEFERKGDDYLNPRLVDFPMNRKNSVRFRFYQDTTKSPMMILIAESSIPGRIAYSASMEIPTEESYKWSKTSTCPLSEGKTVFESWPHPISKIVIRKVRAIRVTVPRATL